MRFTVKDDKLYAVVMAWPQAGSAQPRVINIKTLAQNAQMFSGKVSKVELLGAGPLKFDRQADGLSVTLPEQGGGDLPLVLRISPENAGTLK
jgi:alpha-L-fucosidase